MAYTTKDMNKLFKEINQRPNARRFRFKEVKCEAMDWDGKPVEGNCIIPTSHKPNEWGYVQASVFGTKWWLHRLSWTLVNGQIPEGHHVDHRCGNRACVNPEHLQVLSERLHHIRTNFMEEFSKTADDRNAALCFIHDNRKLDKSLWATHQEISDEFGLGLSTVSSYVRLINERTKASQEINKDSRLDGLQTQQPDHTQ